ncbi:hypothetical protein SARC_02133 [Sphaeroforma arctica JP610]|uniref:Uncharacterized protein n=1 Tax=Sphaeroforma arctica JP610 TaxID=667725 RepID=A0A0L0G9V5_9EUKA|nr:hypothetical protein SARC_02133 [Sphaeroforma arctica JP610]KNC85684.1 hypothetical protein SARC_02133 [Sphaeroforma arctica JP610]|eukprot:XP_014159586.1 hypothetical protein SARC_02133 [Sphaeroforma arctica JP610]
MEVPLPDSTTTNHNSKAINKRNHGSLKSFCMLVLTIGIALMFFAVVYSPQVLPSQPRVHRVSVSTPASPRTQVAPKPKKTSVGVHSSSTGSAGGAVAHLNEAAEDEVVSQNNITYEDTTTANSLSSAQSNRNNGQIFAVFIGDSNDRNSVQAFCKNVLKANMQKGKPRTVLKQAVKTAYDVAVRAARASADNSMAYSIPGSIEKVLSRVEVNYCKTPKMILAYIFNRFAMHPIGPWHGFDKDVRMVGSGWRDSDPSEAHSLLIRPVISALVRTVGKGVPDLVSVASNFWDHARAFDYLSRQTSSNAAYWRDTFIPEYSRNLTSFVSVVRNEIGKISQHGLPHEQTRVAARETMFVWHTAHLPGCEAFARSMKGRHWAKNCSHITMANNASEIACSAMGVPVVDVSGIFEGIRPSNYLTEDYIHLTEKYGLRLVDAVLSKLYKRRR